MHTTQHIHFGLHKYKQKKTFSLNAITKNFTLYVLVSLDYPWVYPLLCTRPNTVFYLGEVWVPGLEYFLLQVLWDHRSWSRPGDKSIGGWTISTGLSNTFLSSSELVNVFFKKINLSLQIRILGQLQSTK